VDLVKKETNGIFSLPAPKPKEEKKEEPAADEKKEGEGENAPTVDEAPKAEDKEMTNEEKK